MSLKNCLRVAAIGLLSTTVVVGAGLSNADAVTADGTIDAAFAAAVQPSLNDLVDAIAVQNDGSIVVGGAFGGTIARFSSAGVPDSSFNTNAGGVTPNRITSVAIDQSDRILAAGWYTGLYRFSSAGVSDSAFAAASSTALGGNVDSVVVQPDGMVLAAGSFTGYLARLNSDGTADAAFNANVGASLDGRIYQMALQPDGKILIAGEFTNHVKRFLPSGLPDTAFNTNAGDAGGTVSIVRVAPNGSVVIVGQFGDRLARYHSDGTPDAAFNANVHAAALEAVGMYALAIQRDGKIVIGGDSATHLARFNADGTTDSAFNATLGSSIDNRVWSVIVDGDDNLLVGGGFTSRLARLSSSYVPTLPPTGSNTNGLVWTALLLLGTGTGLLAVRRRALNAA